MKRTMIKFSVGLFMLFCLHNGFTYGATKSPIHSSVSAAADWAKSTTGTWPGMKDGKTYWYKLDDKGKLWWSMDGKAWAAVKGGAWADSDGKWLKINDMKLVWSTDGKTWAEVPEWKWKGSDGKWYKFDQSWGLWVNG